MSEINNIVSSLEFNIKNHKYSTSYSIFHTQEQKQYLQVYEYIINTLT